MTSDEAIEQMKNVVSAGNISTKGMTHAQAMEMEQHFQGVILATNFPAILSAWEADRAIVERLPKTSDGVPVLPDDILWADDGYEEPRRVRVTRISTKGWFMVGPRYADEDFDMPTASDHEDAPRFYSTREAAIAALDKEGK